MFRLMDHQISMDEAHFWMPEGHREELEQTWPHIFRTQVLKMIPESQFAGLYHETMGRPNFPVAILVGLSILKEMFDLTDKALMSSFRFDMRYHYALGVKLEETELAIRTLYYFRSAVSGSDFVGATFDKVADQIIVTLGLDTSRQRKDSTHIRSNMTNLTRLGLFVRTIGQFLCRLEKDFSDKYHLLPEEIVKRYGERKGHFADAKSSEGRRRLDVTAQDLWLLVERFCGDGSISPLPEYQLLERLLNEQCDVQSDVDGVPIVLKDPKKISSDSLQSPFDPDASYDGHKGVGYQVQVSETCSSDNPIQVVTRVDVEPAHHSDQHALIPALDDLESRGHAPEKMFADTAYNSGTNLIAAAERGVDLISPTPGKADPDGINLGYFNLDLNELKVRACPEGKSPVRDRLGSDGETHNLLFDPQQCKVCDLGIDCPAGKENGRLRIHPNDIAIAFNRAREETEEFKEAYKIRAGGESVNAECKTAHGLAKVWTRGEPKVTFAATMKFMACNVKRFMHYQCAQILKTVEKREPVPA